MSEYQYYEFYNLHTLLSQEARAVMHSLSSRARVSAHGAAYVYNYKDFPGDEKALLLKYFDVFFRISNWGRIQLTFKYPNTVIDLAAIKPYCTQSVIEYEQIDQNTLIDVRTDYESSGWIEGEGLLPDLLPLYDEIKTGNYEWLSLVLALDCRSNEVSKTPNVLATRGKRSLAQQAFLEFVGADEVFDVVSE